MAFPSGASTITLTGTLTVPAGGDATAGKVILTPTAVLADGTHKAIYTGAGSITLDASGSFSVALLCNDSADVRPAPVDGTPGWQWRVDEQPVRGQWRTYWINLPSALGPTVDLAQLTPITAPAPVVGDTTARPIGPAGGALTGAYPNPGLSAATADLFDPAGAATAAQSAATTTAASDATAKVAAHAAASDPHGDRADAAARYVPLTDPRLTNARTPTAHAASHADGGSDPITPAAIEADPAGAAAAAQAAAITTAGADATSKVAAHNVAVDPHGDRAYSNGVTGPIADRVAAVEGGFTTVNSYITDALTRVLALENGVVYKANADITGPLDVAGYTTLAGGQANNDWAVFGSLHHLGSTAGFFGATAAAQPTVAGSQSSGEALTSLLAAMAQLGLITDNTTA